MAAPGAAAGTGTGSGAGSGGQTAMRVAAGRVLAGCEIAPGRRDGVTRKSCGKTGALEHLARAEKQQGSNAALMTYCAMLGESDRSARTLAVARIMALAGSHRTAKQAATPRVFKCLLAKLETSREEHFAGRAARLAQVVTHIGTALDQEGAVITALHRHPQELVMREGYRALWANGRARVFSLLRKKLRGSNHKLTRAVLHGLGRGDAYSEAERQLVCPALVAVLDHGTLSTTEVMRRITRRCGALYSGKVLARARALIGRGKIDSNLVFALREVGQQRSPEAPAPDRVARIVALLDRVLTGRVADDYSRSQALASMHRLDPARGKKRAAAHLRDGSKRVRDAAARIVEKGQQ